MIPEFRDDGYLPEGVHTATEAEITFRFGTASAQRRRLAMRLRRWIELSRSLVAIRLFVNGSFVTAKPDPTISTLLSGLPTISLTECLVAKATLSSWRQCSSPDVPRRFLPRKIAAIGTIG